MPSNCITNFNLFTGDITAGGKSAKERYELLCLTYGERNGVLSSKDIKDSLMNTYQNEQDFKTQWSIVYDQGTQKASYWFNGDFDSEYTFSVVE